MSNKAKEAACAVFIALALATLLLCAIVFAPNPNRLPANPVAIATDAGELEPLAQVEQATEYLPGRPNYVPNHVCPVCPYRHYPAVCPALRPFTVICYHCRTALLVQPPQGKLGDTGQVGDFSIKPETGQ